MLPMVYQGIPQCVITKRVQDPRMVLADLAALLERWLDVGEEVRALG